MKKYLFFLCLLFTFITTSFAQLTIKIYQPIVPYKIKDKYRPASIQKLESLLGQRVDINVEKRLLQIDSAILLSGFRQRPGSQVWIGEHVGKFLFSASLTYQYSKDERIKNLMDAMVRKYISYQLPDGYLGTYLPENYWTEWDVWAHKYAIIGLTRYYSVTGSKPALEAAKKAADLICRTFGDEPGKRDLLKAGHHAGMASGSILEAMIDLYRYTADPKYLDFSKYILRAWERPDGPKIITNLLQYGSVQKVGNAKAYEMLSCLVGIAKYYKLTGEEKYLKPLEIAWNDVVKNRLYITGTASSHERFQEDGILPADTEAKMGEGCVTTTWIQFNLELLSIQGDPKYVEELEKSVYNHLIAAENPLTGCVSYYTAFQNAKPYKCDQGFSCCLSSIPRGIALIPNLIWGKINNVFSILMYESGTVKDTIIASDKSKVVLTIQANTTFPHEGKATYKIMPSAAKKFALNFRVPAWSTNYVLKTNGTTYKGTPGQLLKIEKVWKANDVVNISFGIPIQILLGGRSYPNAVAFQRGPQILAIDQSLNADVTDLSNITFVKQAAIKLQDAKATLPADWSWKQAYSMQLQVNKILQKVTLVPFAEAGQQEGNLRVWIAAANEKGN